MESMLRKMVLMVVALFLCVIYVEAMNVKSVSEGNFNSVADSNVKTMYIIEGNCSLSGDVTLAPGSILKFEGGAISGIGTIKGSQLKIDAPKYQIFDVNINFENNIDSQKGAIANGEVSAHWWGAKEYSDSDFDDARNLKVVKMTD